MSIEDKRILVTMRLPESDYERAKAIARQRGVSVTEAIRGAIATEKYLREAQAAGKKVLIESADVAQELRFD